MAAFARRDAAHEATGAGRGARQACGRRGGPHSCARGGSEDAQTRRYTDAAMRLCERRRLRIQEHGRRASRPLHFFGSVLYCTHAVTDGASFDQRPFCWSDLALTLSTFGGARRVFRSFFAQSKLASDFCCRIARLRTAATHSNRSPSAWIAPHRCCGEPSTTLHSCSSGRRHAAPPRALFPAARLRRRRAANASR